VWDFFSVFAAVFVVVPLQQSIFPSFAAVDFIVHWPVWASVLLTFDAV
jgi:hypothetical protein